MKLFRDLSPSEEAEFRQWARENYEPDSRISPAWHPVVREECEKINQEQEEEESSEDDSWQRERARQAGMVFGSQGYNEVMGCDEQEFSCASCGDRGCDRCWEEVE